MRRIFKAIADYFHRLLDVPEEDFDWGFPKIDFGRPRDLPFVEQRRARNDK